MHAARKLALAIALYAAPVLILPVAGTAHATQAKKKKAKSPKSSAKAKSRAESEESASGAPTHSGPKKIEKVTAGNIAKWVKRGDSETDIIARADAAGYIVNTKDEKVLKKAKVPGTLIASLKGESMPVAAAEPKAEPKAEPAKAKVDLTKPAKPSDIDFDHTPPPPGTPAWVEEKAKDEKKAQATASPEPAKRAAPAARPTAPMIEDTARPASETGVRRPLIPKDS
jgi:hypothetical protein